MLHRKVKKTIQQFSNAELLHQINNSIDKKRKDEAEKEIRKRNLTKEQYEKALKDYEKFKNYLTIRKTKSLSREEFLICFFIPFGKQQILFDAENSTEDEINRFREFGFENKLAQAKTVRLFGIIFYVIFIPIVVILFSYL